MKLEKSKKLIEICTNTQLLIIRNVHIILLFILISLIIYNLLPEQETYLEQFELLYSDTNASNFTTPCSERKVLNVVFYVNKQINKYIKFPFATGKPNQRGPRRRYNGRRLDNALPSGQHLSTN